MHFLVFIPACKPADLEKTAKIAGLTPILGGHDVLPSVVGPNQLTGMMLGHLSPTNPRMNYLPHEQDWIPSVAKSDAGQPMYWVGIWKEKPPIESELRRHYTQDGQLFKFGPEVPDDPRPGYPEIKAAYWKLPSTKTVDSRAVYNDDGTMRWEPLRRFAWLVDEAAFLAKGMLEDGLPFRRACFKLDPTAQVAWLIKLLQINYRILPEVAVYLDLFSGSKDSMIDEIILWTLNLYIKAASDEQ